MIIKRNLPLNKKNKFHITSTGYLGEKTATKALCGRAVNPIQAEIYTNPRNMDYMWYLQQTGKVCRKCLGKL